MEAHTSRLKSIFVQLMNSKLVTDRSTSAESLSAFSDTLSLVRTVTDYERGIADIIRYLYKQNRGTFYRYIQLNEMQYLVLLTDGYPIAEKLEINDLVTIHWDKKEKKFIVRAQNHPDESDQGASREKKPKNYKDSNERDNKERGNRNVKDRGNRDEPRGRKHKKQIAVRKEVDQIVPPLSSEQYVDILNAAKRDPSKSYADVAKKQKEPDTPAPKTDANPPNSQEKINWADDDD